MENQKSWLGKALQAIISLFEAGWEKFVGKAYNKIPDELKEKVSLAVKIVESIKVFIESPTADILTAIIPTTIDDELKVWLRKVLPIILDKYKVISQSKLTPEASHLIATNITQELTGLKFGQAALTTEVVFQNT